MYVCVCVVMCSTCMCVSVGGRIYISVGKHMFCVCIVKYNTFSCNYLSYNCRFELLDVSVVLG